MADVLLALGGDGDLGVEPRRPCWTDQGFGGLVLNAARLQHDVDGQIAPLASWSTNQCAPDGSHDQLLEFSGDSYVIYSGTVPVRLGDRWVKLGRAPSSSPSARRGTPSGRRPTVHDLCRCMAEVLPLPRALDD